MKIKIIILISYVKISAIFSIIVYNNYYFRTIIYLIEVLIKFLFAFVMKQF